MAKKSILSNGASPDEIILAILLWDIINYSKYTPEQLRFLLETIFPSIKQIYDIEKAMMPNTWGDASIAFFPTAINAADAALKIRNLVRQEHQGKFRVKMRIALHVGEISHYHNPITDHETAFGENVNFVARIEPVVSPNSVWATPTFINLLGDSPDNNIEYDEVGERELVKGWGSAKLYQLRYEEEAGFVSQPILTSTSDYDKTILQINDYIDWLIENKYCDTITLYVRDETTRNEFNIEACKGLYDSSPMHGHIVYDDFRLKIIQEEHDDIFEASLPNLGSENLKGFRVREKICSRASFRLKDPFGCKAELFLNWREPQIFASNQQIKLKSFKNEIFEAISAIQGISQRRALIKDKELRTRRWLDFNNPDNSSIDANSSLMIAALKEFFTLEHVFLHFKIILNQKSTLAIINEEFTQEAYFPDPQTIDEDSHCKWVCETTRPLFIENPTPSSKQPICRIIVPIRKPPDIGKSTGVISLECSRPGILKSDMVRFLCSLGDHFGLLIEDQK